MSFVTTRITPVNPDYPTCSECFIRLMIYPEDVHPDRITEIFKITPTSINVAGDSVTNSLGRTRITKYSGWFLLSEGFVRSKDLRDHVDWLVNKIQPFSEQLREIQKIKDIKITLKCVWFSVLGHSGPVLWPEQMRAIADLDLELTFDIYFDEDG